MEELDNLKARAEETLDALKKRPLQQVVKTEKVEELKGLIEDLVYQIEDISNDIHIHESQDV